MEQAPNALTKGSVVKALVTFTLPFLLANVLQSLYGAVDLFVVGQYCDAQSVAAVSTGTQVTQIVTSLVTGLTLGGTILIGKYTGMERWDKVKTAIGTTLSIFALVALALTALMLLFEAPLLTLPNTPAESFEATMEYVAICAWGNFFICGYNSLSAVLRGYGDSVRPMYFVGVACVVNILLDFLFVKYVGLGAGGTALATVLSQGVSMAIGIGYLKRKRFLFDFKPASFRIDPAMAKELARVGIPISFQELMVRISFLSHRCDEPLRGVCRGCGGHWEQVRRVFHALCDLHRQCAGGHYRPEHGGREAGTSEEIVVVRAEFCPSCRLRLLDLGTGESGDDDCPVFRGQWSDCSGGSIFPGMQL